MKSQKKTVRKRPLTVRFD